MRQDASNSMQLRPNGVDAQDDIQLSNVLEKREIRRLINVCFSEQKCDLIATVLTKDFKVVSLPLDQLWVVDSEIFISWVHDMALWKRVCSHVRFDPSTQIHDMGTDCVTFGDISDAKER